MKYRLQYGSGEPGCRWYDDGSDWAFASLKWALECLRHLERTDLLHAWRIVDQDDRCVVMVVPGMRGAA